jgi:uncharacterized protein
MRLILYVSRLLLAGLATATLILIPGYTQRGVDDYLRPPRSLPNSTPADFGLPYQDAPLVTAEGLHLAAWFIRGTRPESLILVHGLGANRASLLPLAADLHQRGYSLMLVELRAHGESQGTVSTLGVKEVDDVRAAYESLAAQPDVDPNRVGIYGSSLAAGAALLAAEKLPRLQAVVADSTFSSVRWVVDNQLQMLLNLPDFFGFFLVNVGRWEAGISADDAAPVRAAAHLGSRSLLVIHGAEDDMFCKENAQAVYDAASGPRRLWIIEGAGHAEAYGLEHETYVARIDSFFQSTLSQVGRGASLAGSAGRRGLRWVDAAPTGGLTPAYTGTVPPAFRTQARIRAIRRGCAIYSCLEAFEMTHMFDHVRKRLDCVRRRPARA